MLFRVAALAAIVSLATAAQQTCDASNKCPSDSPCCSSYGNCGTGAYCLGGCDPKSSYNLQSCMPAPICQSGSFPMNTLDDVSPNTKYLGDASKANWVSSGTPAIFNNQEMLLTMAPNTVGTLLSSTHYVWYGKISASLQTSQGQGVVTAFIMMSDMKDEIDFEFVGVDLEHAQSNFYFQGITNYQNGANLSTTNTVQNYHTYEIDWTPDQLTWSVDGVALRTLKKSDTYNQTDKLYHYPQTPSRVQFSLWPAGLASNGQGTIDWAGGLIDWSSPYMQNGYYYARVKDVSISCYDAPSDATIKGNGAYEYNNVLGVENTVVLTDDNTVLASFQANGNNQQVGAVASGTASSSAASASSTASSDNQVPGISGVGSYGNDATSNSNSGSTSSSTSSGSSSVGGSAQVGFSQGVTKSGTNSEGTRVVAGSLVALVAFFAAAMAL